MNEQITRQAQEMLAVILLTEVPAEVRTLAQDGVTKAREAYAKWIAATQAGTSVLEDIMVATQSGAKSVGEKVIAITVANTEAAFDAAQGLARARTLPEAAQLQAKFVQEQLTVVSEPSQGPAGVDRKGREGDHGCPDRDCDKCWQ